MIRNRDYADCCAETEAYLASKARTIGVSTSAVSAHHSAAVSCPVERYARQANQVGDDGQRNTVGAAACRRDDQTRCFHYQSLTGRSPFPLRVITTTATALRLLMRKEESEEPEAGRAAVDRMEGKMPGRGAGPLDRARGFLSRCKTCWLEVLAALDWPCNAPHVGAA
jgi:hypothetical protein